MSDREYTAHVFREMDKFRKRCKVLERQANDCVFEKDIECARLIKLEITELIQKLIDLNLIKKGKRLKNRLLILETNLTIAIFMESNVN